MAMPPSAESGQAARYVTPDELRVGLYVFVDLPWFLHPFTLNSFRISSPEQLAELRALRLKRYRYDPARSDEPHSGGETAASTEPAAEVGNEPAVPEAAEPEFVQSARDVTEQEVRARRVLEHRRAVAQTEKAFNKATGIIRRATRNVLSQPEAAREEITALADQMADVFLNQPDVSLHVMGEKCGGEEAYVHGLNVSILSMMLAKGLDLSASEARTLGIGALLHDIGQIEIPDRVLKKSPDEFTRAERELHASHVECGVRIGKRMHLAPQALVVIAQHHEMADGSGYPNQLKLEQIDPLARVVSLVNFYENLCNPVLLNQAMTPHEALSFVFSRRRDRFDERVLQLMIRTLGVYPPGSIVKLSNDEIAMVVSVNPQKTLRPWVMLYDASVPKQEAVMLDLNNESGVSIAKSLRPVLLPPAVYSYLSPRRRITYFFDSDVPDSGEHA